MKKPRLGLVDAVELLQNVRIICEDGRIIEDPNEGSLDLLINMTSLKYGISKRQVRITLWIADILERHGILVVSKSNTK